MERLVCEIERYLAAHPQASDSLEGVARWWLGVNNPGTSRQAVGMALAELVRRGALAERTMADGSTLFVATRERLDRSQGK